MTHQRNNSVQPSAARCRDESDTSVRECWRSTHSAKRIVDKPDVEAFFFVEKARSQSMFALFAQKCETNSISLPEVTDQGSQGEHVKERVACYGMETKA